MYHLLLKLLWRLDAERAHALGSAVLRAVAALLPLRAAAAPPLRSRAGTRCRYGALGLDFPSPLGVAAGFDKQARTFAGLGALGFGAVEVGTVTALAQPGNERPRVFRLPADRALVNRMGFPNAGAEAIAPRLAGAAGRPAAPSSASTSARPRSCRPRRRSPTTAPARGCWRPCGLPGDQRQLAEHPGSARPADRGAPARARGGDPRRGRAARRRCWSRSPRTCPTRRSTRSPTSRWRSSSTASSPSTPRSRATVWPATRRPSRRPAPAASPDRRCAARALEVLRRLRRGRAGG